MKISDNPVAMNFIYTSLKLEAISERQIIVSYMGYVYINVFLWLLAGQYIEYWCFCILQLYT